MATFEELRAAGVTMLELSFVDNAGIARVKTVPLLTPAWGALAKYAENSTIGSGSSVFNHPSRPARAGVAPDQMRITPARK